MNYSIIIDGPNLISGAIGLGLDIDHFTKKFSLNILVDHFIKREILNKFFTGSPLVPTIEFICSNKLPGPKGQKLNKVQWGTLLNRFSHEDAVSVIKITTKREKGVDLAIVARMMETAENSDIICLLSSDKDYLPAIEYLKRKGKQLVTIGTGKDHPTELKNASYLFIDITEYLAYAGMSMNSGRIQ